jgi:serine/threonine-protein phosphatase 5
MLKKSAFDQIDIEAMRASKVESDYKGPNLNEKNEITQEFVSQLLDHFRDQKILHKKYAYEILFKIRDFFKQQPTLVDIKIGDDDKFTICGDIHGQYYDLLNIFKLNSIPSETNPYVILILNFYFLKILK